MYCLCFPCYSHTFPVLIHLFIIFTFGFSLTSGCERGRKRRRKRHSGFIWLLSAGFSCHPQSPARSEHTAKPHVHTANKTKTSLGLLAASSLTFLHRQRRKHRVCLSEDTQTEPVSHKRAYPRWLCVSFHLFIYCKTRCGEPGVGFLCLTPSFRLISSSSHPVYAPLFLLVLSCYLLASTRRSYLSFIRSNLISDKTWKRLSARSWNQFMNVENCFNEWRAQTLVQSNSRTFQACEIPLNSRTHHGTVWDTDQG